MESNSDTYTLNEAVSSALNCLGQNSGVGGSTSADSEIDDYLRNSVLSLAALESENIGDFVSDQSRDLANSAVLKTLSDYQTLMGGSPQKLTPLHSMATPTRSGNATHSNSDSDYSSQRTQSFAPSSEFDESTMDESQLIQWCFEDEETGDQYINDESEMGEDMDYMQMDASDEARYAYVENEDAMIAIDRKQLENLVSGKSIPDVKSIIIAQPPSKPDSLSQLSTSNHFMERGASEKHSSWKYDAEDDDEESEFPFLSKTSGKGRRAVGKAKVGSRKVIAGLPEHLKGLLGQANLFRARGNDDEALKLCLEIIRQCPGGAEPFKTVGAIYEANGELEKAMQFYTISTHLSATDDVIWEKLVQYNLEKSEIDITTPTDEANPTTLTTQQYEYLKETSRCCTRALIDCKLAEDPEALGQLKRFALIRLQCAEKMGERGRKKAAIKRYLLLLKNNIEPEVYNEMAHRVIGYYFEDKEQIKALEVLENLRVFFPQFLTLGDLNILLELFMVAKMYGKCLKVAAKTFNIKLIKEGSSGDGLESKDEENDDDIELMGTSLKIADVEHPKYKDITMPPEVHLDIKVKIIVSLIYTGNEHLVDKFVEELLSLEDLLEIQDMFTDICEAYREMNCRRDELKVWKRLSNENVYCNSDDVWLRLGECQWELNEYEEAEVSFKNTLSLNPENVQARLSLAIYYKNYLNDSSAALSMLDVPYGLSDAVKTDVRLVNMRLDLQEASSDLEFFQTVYEIFHYVFTTAKYFKDKDTVEDEIKLPLLGTVGEDEEELLDESAQEDYPSNSENPSLKEFLWYLENKTGRHKCKMFSVQTQIRQRLNVSWEKFQKAVILGLRLDRKNDVLYMVVMAAQNNVYPDRTKDLHLFASKLGIELKSPCVYYCAKHLLTSSSYNSNQAWSLFHLVATFVGDCRPTKHLLHLDKTQPIRSFNKSLFLAVSYLESGSYKMALAELSLHFVQQEKTPLYNFFIGILYLHLGSQRFSRNKGTLFTLSIFFLKRYHIFRDNPQESLYNIGRAFHQIEILPHAIYYYEKCLLEPVKKADDTGQSFSIHRYAVHNLYRIYMGSGSKILALNLLKKYPLD